MVFRLFEHFYDFQRGFYAQSLAYSRTLNSRNLECYWYPLWDHSLNLLIRGNSRLLVAPQYHLWCVKDEDEEKEPPPGANEAALSVVLDDEEVDDDDVTKDFEDLDWVKPKTLPSDLAGFVDADDEEPGDDSFDLAGETSGITVAQSKTLSQIADFAIIEVVPFFQPAATAPTTTLKKIFDDYVALGKKVAGKMLALIRSRHGEAPIGKQLPRILIENKRYFHRSITNPKEIKERLGVKMLEAQGQASLQAAVLFCMPEAEADVVILIAAVGPYYTTAQVKRRRNIEAGFVQKAIKQKDITALKGTLVISPWTASVHVGTPASDKRFTQMKKKLGDWATFSKGVSGA
ncbi:hypothetical protein C8R43DRAFT_1127307 [Mycena crocata]|nr:hypothetical protein C8R43DRAFT_1127307 [Mycena crocata]